MDLEPDNEKNGIAIPLILKLLPLLFFNSAFAAAYAGFLIRETSVRTYATELACLIPGFLFCIFAACGALSGGFFRKNASAAGAFFSPFPVLFSALLLPALLPLFSMTRRSIISALLLLPLLTLPLFFSGLNVSFVLRANCSRRSTPLFGLHSAGAALSAFLFTVLIHSFNDMLLMLMLSGLFLLLLAFLVYGPQLKRFSARILLFLITLSTAAVLIHTTCGFLENRLFHADPFRGDNDTVRLDTPYGRSELVKLPDKRFLFTTNGQNIATQTENPYRNNLTA